MLRAELRSVIAQMRAIQADARARLRYLETLEAEQTVGI